jgi:hypothetical protein
LNYVFYFCDVNDGSGIKISTCAAVPGQIVILPDLLFSIFRTAFRRSPAFPLYPNYTCKCNAADNISADTFFACRYAQSFHLKSAAIDMLRFCFHIKF